MAAPYVHRLKQDGFKAVVAGHLRLGRSASSIIIVTTALMQDLQERWDGTVTRNKAYHLDNKKVRIFLVPVQPEGFGAALISYTGILEFKKKICTAAREQRLMLNDKGLWQGANQLAGRTERQIFTALGIPFVLPKDRIYWNDKGWEAVLDEERAKQRKMVYLAVQLIMDGRKRGSVPVGLHEVEDQTMLPRKTCKATLQWLVRHDLIIQGDGKGMERSRGYLPRVLPKDGICWVHGTELPCRTGTCNRKEKRKENA